MSPQVAGKKTTMAKLNVDGGETGIWVFQLMNYPLTLAGLLQFTVFCVVFLGID